MHGDASGTRVLPIHQVMPVLHTLADYSSLQLPARLDVLDAFTFDLQTLLMLKEKSCFQIPLSFCTFNEVFQGPHSSFPDLHLLK